MIRALYFTGGANSFAVRVHQQFLTGFGNDGHGMMEREVPMLMVALVATAVSDCLSNSCKKLI